MQTSETIKQTVKEKYGEIARTSSSCCGGSSGCSDSEVQVKENYSQLSGYVPEADLGLGCGLPTEYAGIKEGDTVVDLGSGAGNDCFVARQIVGDSGRVIGIDMTEDMIEKAQTNAGKLGYDNVEFRLGDIESLPLPDNLADVVVSNCVLNLVPDKQRGFDEIYRILKPGAHFSISDIVTSHDMPATLKSVAELYVGCVSGALPKPEYLSILRETGFEHVEVQKERQISIPEDLQKKYLTPKEIAELRTRGFAVFSITVSGEKPKRK